MSDSITCPRCKVIWPYGSEQAQGVEITGHCMGCEVLDEIAGNPTWSAEQWKEVLSSAQVKTSALLAGGFHGYLCELQGG